jgi:hypothetical protein
MKRLALLALILLLVPACAAPSAQASNSQPEQSTYIENKGSDTIVNLALGR